MSRKLADAHIQFGTEGLPKLISDVKAAGKAVSQELGKGGSKPDSAQLDHIARIRKEFGRLRAEMAKLATKPIIIPLKIERINESFQSDRGAAVNRARRRSDRAVSGRTEQGMAASPSMMAGVQTANRTQRESLRASRQGIMDFIKQSPTLSGKFSDKTSGLGRADLTKSAAPYQLRETADGIDEMIKGISRFGRAGTKTAADVNTVKKEMEDLAAAARKMANESEKLQSAMDLSKSLSNQEKGALRGSLKDEAGSEARTNATMDRQEERDFRKVSGKELMGRRIGEIQATGKAEGFTGGDINAEIGIAANAVAESLRTLAGEVREANLDEALASLARKLQNGSISNEDFMADATKIAAQKKGTGRAGEITENSNFLARNEGASERTVAIKETVSALDEEIAKTQESIDSTDKKTDAEKKALKEKKSLLTAERDFAESQAVSSEELDKAEISLKKQIGALSRLDVKKSKGGTLTKKETADRKALKKAIDREAEALQKLKVAQGGQNAKMHAAAGASRRFNFQLQQASYGVQDFVQVIGQTGLSGALRASANNMASFFGASGTPTGAIIGAVGTIAMIGFADAITSMGEEAETAEEKMEKLLKTTKMFSEIRMQARDFAGSSASGIMGLIGKTTDPGVEARARARASSKEAGSTGDEIKTSANALGEEVHKNERGRSVIGQDLFGDSTSSVAALKLSGVQGKALDDAIEKSKADIYTSVLGSRRKIDTGMPKYDSGVSQEDAEKGLKEYLSKGGVDSTQRQQLQAILKVEKELREIKSADMSNPADVGKVGLIAKQDKTLEDATKKYTNLTRDQSTALIQSESDLTRLNESLSVLEANISGQSVFSDTATKEASQAISSELTKSAARLRSGFAEVALLRGDEAKLQRELNDAEQKQYDAYLASLLRINSEMSDAANSISGISKKLSEIQAGVVSRRIDKERSLAHASPEDRKDALASFDKQEVANALRVSKVDVQSFSGQAEMLLGETQQQANDRQVMAIEELINKIQLTERKDDDAVIPVLRTAIDKLKNDDSESKLSVTPLASLHQKIQESLTGNNIENEKITLLTQIELNTRPLAPGAPIMHPAPAAPGAIGDEEFGGGSGRRRSGNTPIDPSSVNEIDSTPESEEAGNGDTLKDRMNERRNYDAMSLETDPAANVEPVAPPETARDKKLAELKADVEAAEKAEDKALDEFRKTGVGLEHLKDAGDVAREAMRKYKEFRNAEPASGQMSVPPPEFDPSMMAPASAGQMSVPPPEFDPSTMGAHPDSVVAARSRTEETVAATEGMAAQAPLTNSRNADETMHEILDDLGKARTSNFIDRSNQEQQSIGTRSRSRDELKERNIRAMQGGGFEDQGSAADAIGRAQENVRRQGYRGNVRGGAVTDTPGQRRGVYDGPQGSLTASQMNTINSPAGGGAVPGESPEENRKRRINERNKKFGNATYAGKDGLNTGGNTDGRFLNAGPQVMPTNVDDILAGMKPGPDYGPEVNEGNVDRTPVFDYGPEVTSESVKKGLTDGSFRASSSGRAMNRDASDRADDVSDAAGGALKGEGRAEEGPRTKMRRLGRLAAVRARREQEAKEKLDAKAKRDKEVSDREENYWQQLGVQPEQRKLKRRRGNRDKPSFMENLENGNLDAFGEPINTAAVPAAVPDLASNVSTEATGQVASLNQESLEYNRRSANTLDSILGILEGATPEQPLMIS